jgi:hypothetical protein
MEGSEYRRVHETDLRAREGATFVYKELPKWLFVAQLEALAIDDWGIKVIVLPLPVFGLSSLPEAFIVSGAWDILSLSEGRWSAAYAGWSMLFGEEIVAQLKSQAAEFAHLDLTERLPALMRSLSGSIGKLR